MKKLLILFAFVLLALNISAQWWKPQHHLYDTVEYVVMYELTLREDTTHLEYSRTDDYMLSIGKNNIISSFRGYNNYRGDMELKKASDNGSVDELINTGHIGEIYKGIGTSIHKFDIFPVFVMRYPKLRFTQFETMSTSSFCSSSILSMTFDGLVCPGFV